MGKRPRQFSGINKNGNSSGNPDRKPKGGSMRSKSTITRLNMYNSGRPERNRDGKIVGGILMMNNTAGGKTLAPNAQARIAPDRRWFGNTRTIAQTELDKFRDDMSLREADPYSVILRRKKIPMALLQDCKKVKSVNLLETESYEDAFGSKVKRKRPKFSEALTSSYSALMAHATEKNQEYDVNPDRDTNVVLSDDGSRVAVKADLFAKGQSKRIWGELYKVLDCSDVVLQIVDARNVPGTRCAHVEHHIKKNANHKHMVIIINKCDLVPNWVTRRWIKLLAADFPTVAFHAHMTKSFGKSALINLLRQYSKLHAVSIC
jgi:nuclear GTP-binding protein